jgi:hypothetical protein
LLTAEEREWVDEIQANSVGRIKDFFKVRVGIKTTADKVFIRNDWEDLPEAMRPESELLRPILSRRDADRWVKRSVTGPQYMVLYTHEVKNGTRRAIEAAEFPRAAAYLESRRRPLESRKY